MSLIKSASGKIVLLLFMVFAFSTAEKINKINTGEKTCVCAYDGFGYYMYLPHIFEKGHLDIQKEWAQNLQNEYCNGAVTYQLERHYLDKNIDIYHMGLAFVMLPSYTIADISARIGGYKTDGFSYPYNVGYQLNALLFIFLGLLYSRKLLRLFTNELKTSVALILVALGANSYFIFTQQNDLPHLYLFVINAASSYHLFQYYYHDKKRSILFAALLFGLSVCIRPTQALFGIIPFILLLKKHGRTKEFLFKIAIFPIAAIIWNIPQIIYWKVIGGEFIIPNLHTEDMVFTDPNLLDFLFSYRKGWLLYTPIFILLPIGWWFMFKKDRTLFYATLSFSVVYIYAMSSWECWWYAASFGQRVMVDIYPILAIPLVFVLNEFKKPLTTAAASLFALGCITLNLFQSEQMNRGIMDGFRMSQAHYWHIWGELNRYKVHNRWLLINRENINWPKELSQFDDNPFEIKSKMVFQIKAPLVSEPGNHVSIDKIHVLKTFKTDETLVEVPIKFRTSDSTQSSLLRMECVSAWNCYSWNNIELSLGRPQNQIITDTLRFNLPDVRHANDSMQMYLWNDGSAKIEVLEFKIKATSLIRN